MKGKRPDRAVIHTRSVESGEGGAAISFIYGDNSEPQRVLIAPGKPELAAKQPADLVIAEPVISAVLRKRLERMLPGVKVRVDKRTASRGVGGDGDGKLFPGAPQRQPDATDRWLVDRLRVKRANSILSAREGDAASAAFSVTFEIGTKALVFRGNSFEARGLRPRQTKTGASGSEAPASTVTKVSFRE